MQLNDILRMADDRGASDVHLVPDHPPMIRVNTVMEPLMEGVLSAQQTKAFLDEMINERQKTMFEENLDLDFSHAVDGLAPALCLR